MPHQPVLQQWCILSGLGGHSATTRTQSFGCCAESGHSAVHTGDSFGIVCHPRCSPCSLLLQQLSLIMLSYSLPDLCCAHAAGVIADKTRRDSVMRFSGVAMLGAPTPRLLYA